MAFILQTLLFSVCLIKWTLGRISIDRMSGLHLKFCCSELPGTLSGERNASGHFLTKQGTVIEMLDWMETRFNITYECAPIIFLLMEDSNATPGGMHYVKTGACDLLVGAIVLRHDRFQHLNYIQPFSTELVVLVIPSPDSSLTLSAVWKPFEINIWLVLIPSVLVVIAAMTYLNFLNVSGISQKIFASSLNHGMFVVGLLCAQAGPLLARRFKLRCVGGAWCLAALILTTAYSSVLTSFITAPNFEPLLNSVEELADKSEVNLVIQRSYATEVTIMKSTDDPLMRKLARKLLDNPFSRCPNVVSCIEQVKRGSSVFIHPYRLLLKNVMDDMQKTGRCNVALARGIFTTFTAAWMISKGNTHEEYFNQAIMQMREVGLFAKWTEDYYPKPRGCLLNPNESWKLKKGFENSKPNRIALKQLASGFIALLFGFVASIFAFCVERLVTWCNKQNFPTIW